MDVSLQHNGKQYDLWSVEALLDEGVPEDVIAAALKPKQIRQLVRSQIAVQAGDTLSLLGTASDAAALATLGVAALTTALAGAGNYTEFKAAFLATLGKLAGDQDMVAVSAGFLAKIEAGEVLIPVMIKGVGDVMADIENRSTAVSEALIAADAE